MTIVTWLLKFYPRQWRERYQGEMLALLEQHTISPMTILDLLLGALDARLDPTYRNREGFMFHQLRDPRTLSLVFICALALSYFLAYFWVVMHHLLAFVDNPLGVATDSLVVCSAFIIPGLCLVALLMLAGSTLTNAVRNRHFGTLIFAIICLALGVMGAFQMLPLVGSLLLICLGMALCIGTGLFMIGIKGLQAIQQRQWGLLTFALAITLLLPAGLIVYTLYGTYPINGTMRISSGFILGNVGFPSIGNFLTFLLGQMGPYLLMGALLLAVANIEAGTRGWQVARGFGIGFVLVLIANLVAIVTWDINRWLGGGVGIFTPTYGIWSLFGGQWEGPLITNALLLTIVLGLALVALVHSFLIRSGNRQRVRPVTA